MILDENNNIINVTEQLPKSSKRRHNDAEDLKSSKKKKPVEL